MDPQVRAGVLLASVLVCFLEPAPAQTWSTAAPMPTARSGIALGAVNGKPYAVGGIRFVSNAWEYVYTLEVYDPTTNTWTTGTGGDMKREHAAAATIDGKLYIVGGRIGVDWVRSLTIYDPSSDTWKKGSSMPTYREGCGAGVINGKLYVVGGGNREGYTKSLEIYNPVTDVWRTGPSTLFTHSQAAVGVIGDKLYVVGGVGSRELEIYDPATNVWTTGTPMPDDCYFPVAGVVGGKLFVVGPKYGEDVTSVAVYDPTQEAWTTGPALPTFPYGAAAAVIGGDLYFVGSDFTERLVVPLAVPDALDSPQAFSLSQNTPNPFNPSTALRFGLPETGNARLAVYDVTGALVITLVDRHVQAGIHEVVWDGRDANGRDAASGVYVYRLTTAHGVLTKRMVLLR